MGSPRTWNRRHGARAEWLAAKALVGRGYRIAERNFRVRIGELDLIAWDQDTLVFVEVRSRGSGEYGGAIEAIGARKRHQVSRVAALYLALRGLRPRRCRFDVVAVTGTTVVVIADAWRLDDVGSYRRR